MRPAWLCVLLWLACSGMSLAACLRDYHVPYITLGYASYTDEQGQPAGYFIDLYRELSHRTGCRFVIEPMPAQRLRATMVVNRIPLFGPAAAPATSEARAQRRFVPLTREPMELVVRKNLAVRNVADAMGRPGLVFGTIRGASYGEWVEQNLPRLPAAQREESVDAETVYRKLVAGRIGATFGNAYVYRWHLDRMQEPDSVSVLPLPERHRTLVGMVFNHDGMAPEDLERLVRAVVAIRDDGSFRRMVARYLGDDLARDRLYQGSASHP